MALNHSVYLSSNLFIYLFTEKEETGKINQVTIVSSVGQNVLHYFIKCSDRMYLLILLTQLHFPPNSLHVAGFFFYLPSRDATTKNTSKVIEASTKC